MACVCVLPRTSQLPGLRMLTLQSPLPPPSEWDHLEHCGRAFLKHVQQTEDKTIEDGEVDEATMEQQIHLLDNLTAKNIVNMSYYDLLGLGDNGFACDAETIKYAYRKAILLYHPDKSQLKRDKAVFLAIQEAYNTLSNYNKRRAYDSSLPFDEDVPEIDEVTDDQSFYEIFRPVFTRNARFAVRKPVPDLGDDNTHIDKVDSFYSYWVRFESWRDFTHSVGEYDPEEATCREEKRWMIKENEKRAKDLKKAEYRRLSKLVERAMKVDPRLRRVKEAEREAKRREEERREEERRLKQEEAMRIMEQERLRKEEEERVRKEQKGIRERARKALQKARNTFRRSLDPHVLCSMDIEDVEFLCANCDTEELNDFAAMFNSISPVDSSAEEHGTYLSQLRDRESICLERVEDVKDRQRIAKEDGSKSTAKGASATIAITLNTTSKKQREWTQEELAMLAKAITKFPAGLGSRWVTVANFVNQQTAPIIPVTKDDCISQYQKLASRPTALVGSAHAKANVVLPASAPTIAPASELSTLTVDTPPPLPPSGLTAEPQKATSDAGESKEDDWTQDQQRQLEEGLKRFPASMDKNERWKKISEGVSSKSKKQCIERFKALRAAVQAKKQG